MKALSRATFKTKDSSKMPKGAKILSRDTSITVEEIENGFIITKSTDVKYEHNKETEMEYQMKRYFSRTNPLEVDMEKIEDKYLADSFK